MNRYQFAGPLRQSHPAKSLSVVREDLEKSNPPQISFFPNLHCQPSPSFGLRNLMTAPCESHPLYFTDISSWDGRSVYDATLECAWGKFFLVWRKIRNYRFRIFNFDAELEWCKFRALTVHTVSLSFSGLYSGGPAGPHLAMKTSNPAYNPPSTSRIPQLLQLTTQ